MTSLIPVPVALLPVSVVGNRSRHFPSLPVLRDVPNHNHFRSPYFRLRCFSGSFVP